MPVKFLSKAISRPAEKHSLSGLQLAALLRLRPRHGLAPMSGPRPDTISDKTRFSLTTALAPFALGL
jgi:hypothetical protein